MKITQNTRERLVIKDFPWAFGLIFLLLGGAALVFGVKALIYSRGSDKAEWVFALVGLLFLLATAVFTRRTVFVFDLVQQQVSWSRRSLFGWKSGTLAMGRITGCIVQMMQMDREAPTYRLTLASPDGDLPLTETYSSGSVAARQKMREVIHAALGLPTPEPEAKPDIDDQVKALLTNGRLIAAVKLIRDTRGGSLKEAKEYVESLK